MITGVGLSVGLGVGLAVGGSVTGGSVSLSTGLLGLGVGCTHRTPLGVAQLHDEWSLVQRTYRSPCPLSTTRSLAPCWPTMVVHGPT